MVTLFATSLIISLQLLTLSPFYQFKEIPIFMPYRVHNSMRSIGNKHLFISNHYVVVFQYFDHFIIFNMSDITIDLVEKNTDAILEKVGKGPYVNWEEFTIGSADVVRAIDELNSSISTFRETQHKNFIQTMKKMKSLDLPDLLQAVKSKKLPKEALRGVIGRFKLEGENLELVESADSLKEGAKKEYEQYMAKNKSFVDEMKKMTEYFNTKAFESGFKEPELPQLKATVKFNLSEELASKIASDIKIQYVSQANQLISFNTYSQIVEGTFKLVADEYKRITFDARNKQRGEKNHYPNYLNAMNEYLTNSEALINDAQAMIAGKVGISEKKLGESELFLMEKGLSQNLLMLQTGLRGKIKESIKSDKDVEASTAKEVIQYQVKMIDEKAKDIDAILSNMEKGPEAIQAIPILLALILNDYVFEKYGYEEEDFMKNLSEEVITTNPEFLNIFKEMEMGIMKLMQNLQVIPPEVVNAMKQQEEMFKQMGGQMGPGQIPPGMMPPGMGMMPGMMGPPGMGAPGGNTNPMDMLQMQQLQQMQQMFGMMQPPK